MLLKTGSGIAGTIWSFVLLKKGGEIKKEGDIRTAAEHYFAYASLGVAYAYWVRILMFCVRNAMDFFLLSCFLL